uniref:Uncharacterized protein n=1 Tax=Brassica oleracea var. oleracea TaxID=109376 RepID=A0A0D3ASS5_BRAOL
MARNQSSHFISSDFLPSPSTEARARNVKKAGELIGVDMVFLDEKGDGLSCTVPIYEGYAFPHAILCLDLGGLDLTNALMKILTERGPRPHQSVKLSQTYKRSFATLVLTKDLEKAKTSSVVEKNYELPDGKVITIGSERFRCPEDREGRVCNTVISGGKHIFSGIANKMSYDITAWAPKEEYDESCPSVIHRKVGLIAPLPATRVLFQKLSESDMLRGPLISKFLVSIILRFPDIPMISALKTHNHQTFSKALVYGK